MFILNMTFGSFVWFITFSSMFVVDPYGIYFGNIEKNVDFFFIFVLHFSMFNDLFWFNISLGCIIDMNFLLDFMFV